MLAFEPVDPPPIRPLVLEFEFPEFTLTEVKSPKSVALPVVAKVMYCITFSCKNVKSNKKLIGIAVSDEQGLDILNALRDVYLRIEEEPDNAKQMLTMLGIILLASSQGEGKTISNEIAVQAAMEEFDIHMNRMLDEESK